MIRGGGGNKGGGRVDRGRFASTTATTITGGHS